MKLLSNEQHASLVARATNWDVIVGQVREAEPSLAAEAGPEDLFSVLSNGLQSTDATASEATANLTASLQTANEEIADLKAKLKVANDEVAQLKGVPAAIPAAANPGAAETNATEKDPLAKINDEYNGDPKAMMAALKTLGIN